MHKRTCVNICSMCVVVCMRCACFFQPTVALVEVSMRVHLLTACACACVCVPQPAVTGKVNCEHQSTSSVLSHRNAIKCGGGPERGGIGTRRRHVRFLLFIFFGTVGMYARVILAFVLRKSRQLTNVRRAGRQRKFRATWGDGARSPEGRACK